jgi:adenylate cyclase
MAKKFDYTTVAQRYTGKFPVLTYVGIQTNFWITANILLIAIIHLQLQIVGQVFDIPVAQRFLPGLLLAILLGVFYGVTLGLAGFFLERRLFRKYSLGKVILFKAMGSLAILTFLVAFIRFFLFELVIAPSLFIRENYLDDQSWRYVYDLLLIYYFFMTLVISFINQVNKKYGPGVLVPLLLGKYRSPKEEQRIFMFMDLKASVTIAEQLGHLKYSSFIRDCFFDINEVLIPFSAQVYQYVGDEIVVTWPEEEGLKQLHCIKFYFACRRQFSKRSDYYMRNYGLIPDFKAGAHTGKVTAVEIGEVKRDIAYHGDTLNTASRLQGLCNGYNKNFITSEYLFSKITLDDSLKAEMLGMVLLKGKTEKIGVISIDYTAKD